MFRRISPDPARDRTNEDLPPFGLAAGPRVDQTDADCASAGAAPPIDTNADPEAQQAQPEPHWPRFDLGHERALAVAEFVAI
jgi:hypothetical protein